MQAQSKNLMLLVVGLIGTWLMYRFSLEVWCWVYGLVY